MPSATGKNCWLVRRDDDALVGVSKCADEPEAVVLNRNPGGEIGLNAERLLAEVVGANDEVGARVAGPEPGSSDPRRATQYTRVKSSANHESKAKRRLGEPVTKHIHVTGVVGVEDEPDTLSADVDARLYVIEMCSVLCCA